MYNGRENRRRERNPTLEILFELEREHFSPVPRTHTLRRWAGRDVIAKPNKSSSVTMAWKYSPLVVSAFYEMQIPQIDFYIAFVNIKSDAILWRYARKYQKWKYKCCKRKNLLLAVGIFNRSCIVVEECLLIYEFAKTAISSFDIPYSYVSISWYTTRPGAFFKKGKGRGEKEGGDGKVKRFTRCCFVTSFTDWQM